MTTVARFFVSGRVQGVFFRASTREHALRLGLAGHARNLADGRVEVVAAGDPHAIEALAAWLAEGPPLAVVAGVERNAPADDAPAPDAGFHVR
ncbi:acylphosphatase [Luteimonas sp. BDR2-5]|uniref:acylphosphatase n=1 Tax=Proluteimonas luteida TaxID=2878685 RepID=UPI001E3EAD9A|nr:acylphosphatase [Luteimonas sp. BDR2-5]MCD9028954.1 acylphosphatase [Luteimonas sp. BDR2-5]